MGVAREMISRTTFGNPQDSGDDVTHFPKMRAELSSVHTSSGSDLCSTKDQRDQPGTGAAAGPSHDRPARRALDLYRYWRADLRPASAPSDATSRAILYMMRDSIAVHLRSDAPLGAFLSGGVDSATICALAAEHRPDLLTFTVGFEREGYNEIDRAQETAAAIGVKSVPYVISQEEFFRYLPQIIWHLDDPMVNESAVPLWFVAREASKQVKVVLLGEGSTSSCAVGPWIPATCLV